LVDKEQSDLNILRLDLHYLKDVKDYVKVFDFSNLDLEFDRLNDSFIEHDYIIFENLYSVENIYELNENLNECLIIEETVEEIVYDGEDVGEEYFKTYIETSSCFKNYKNKSEV